MKLFYILGLFLILQSSMTFARSALPRPVAPQANEQFTQLTEHFVVNGRTIAWLEFSEEQLAHLSDPELRLLRNHIYARQQVKFSDMNLARYFAQFDWYQANIETSQVELTEIDQTNLDLIRRFEDRKIITFDASSTESRYLKALRGCWQEGSSVLASGYRERLTFYPEDRSFAHSANPMVRPVLNALIARTGRFQLLKENLIELEIYEKRSYTSAPGGSSRKILKESAQAFTRAEGYEFSSPTISDISVVEIEHEIIKQYFSLDDKLFWRIHSDPNQCGSSVK